MKNLQLIKLLIILTSFTGYSQTDYCKGWEKGYKQGYCYKEIGCVSPVTPVCPVPNIGERNYTDGYNRGILKGNSGKRKNKSDNSNYTVNNTLKKFRPVTTNYGSQFRDYARRNRRLAEERSLTRQKSLPHFRKAIERAKKAINEKDYWECIRQYNNSKDLGWYDGGFEHMVAGSYFQIWKQERDKEYKKKAKKFLKLSKKHGNKQAELDLKKLSHLFKKYENKKERNNVYKGDLIINKQSQIDAFNYSEVTGDLKINDAENLKGLISLTSIGGNLKISGNSDLVSLKGLDNLASINGSLNIMSNKNLVSISNLKNLTSIGNLLIWGNASLNTLNGLDNITSIDNDIKIGYNKVLNSFCAIKKLITNKQLTKSNYTATNNFYNPTIIQVKNNIGSCKENSISKNNIINEDALKHLNKYLSDKNIMADNKTELLFNKYTNSLDYSSKTVMYENPLLEKDIYSKLTSEFSIPVNEVIKITESITQKNKITVMVFFLHLNKKVKHILKNKTKGEFLEEKITYRNKVFFSPEKKLSNSDIKKLQLLIREVFVGVNIETEYN